MEYLIHVVDESSQHKKITEESQDFQIIEGQSENGEVGSIVKSDAFYLIADESPIDAVISVANIIMVKDTDNKPIPLSSLLSQSKLASENSSTEDDTFLPLKTTNLEIAENTNSELIKASCQIKRINNEETWIELHNICFYVVPREKIVFVK